MPRRLSEPPGAEQTFKTDRLDPKTGSGQHDHKSPTLGETNSAQGSSQLSSGQVRKNNNYHNTGILFEILTKLTRQESAQRARGTKKDHETLFEKHGIL